MVKISKNPDVNWRNNAIQFPRVIAEAMAAGAFDAKVVDAMAESMDLKGFLGRPAGEWLA